MTVVFAKVATLLVLWALAAAEWLISASQIQIVNTAMNFASLAIVVAGLYFAPRAFKAKAMENELREKDRIIATRTQLAEAAEAVELQAREKAAELGGLLDVARHDAAAWEARYAEQTKYTAGPALEAIQTLLARSDKQSERRHKEMLLALRALRHLVPGAPPLEEDDVPQVGPSA